MPNEGPDTLLAFLSTQPSAKTARALALAGLDADPSVLVATIRDAWRFEGLRMRLVHALDEVLAQRGRPDLTFRRVAGLAASANGPVISFDLPYLAPPPDREPWDSLGERIAGSAEARIVLVGPAGAAKSSLLAWTALRCRGRFPGGVWWLDAASDPAAALASLAARVCDPGRASVDARASRVRAALAHRRALLVLDGVDGPAGIDPWTPWLPTTPATIWASARAPVAGFACFELSVPATELPLALRLDAVAAVAQSGMERRLARLPASSPAACALVTSLSVNRAAQNLSAPAHSVLVLASWAPGILARPDAVELATNLGTDALTDAIDELRRAGLLDAGPPVTLPRAVAEQLESRASPEDAARQAGVLLALQQPLPRAVEDRVLDVVERLMEWPAALRQTYAATLVRQALAAMAQDHPAAAVAGLERAQAALAQEAPSPVATLVRYHLGRAWIALGNVDAAREPLRAALTTLSDLAPSSAEQEHHRALLAGRIASHLSLCARAQGLAGESEAWRQMAAGLLGPEPQEEEDGQESS